MRKVHLMTGLSSVALLMATTACSNGDSNDTGEEQQDVSGLNESEPSIDLEDTSNNDDEEVQEDQTDSGSDEDIDDAEEVQEEEVQADSDTNEDDGNESEDMADLRAYYESLAVTSESREVHSNALENLELPGIHENTIIYNGTVSPDQTVSFVFPDDDSEQDFDYSDPLDAEVSDEGHFSVSFGGYDLDEMSEIRFIVTGSLPQEQAFDLPIHSAEEGMEYIQSDANTEEIEESIRPNVQLDDIYENMRFYRVLNVLDDVEAVHFEHTNLGFSHDMIAPSADEELKSLITTTFDEADLEAEDILTFYIVAGGVTTVIEKEVQSWSDEEWARIDEIKEETELEEISKDTLEFAGKTVPHAEVSIINLNPRNFNIQLDADENGQFEANSQDNVENITSDTILYQIVDEEGHLAAFEKPLN